MQMMMLCTVLVVKYISSLQLLSADVFTLFFDDLALY